MPDTKKGANMESERVKLPRMPALTNGYLVAGNHPPLTENNDGELTQGLFNLNSNEWDQQTLASAFINHPVKETSSISGGDNDGEPTDKDGGKDVPRTEQKQSSLSREFTFTGYDIMSDVVPKSQTNEEESADERTCRRYRAQYEDACNRYGVIPVGAVSRTLTHKELSLKHRCLGPGGVKAIAVALVKNKSVSSLSLEYSDLRTEGVAAICEMLEVNYTITELNLTGNNIGGSAITRLLSDLLVNHDYLKKLNLSENGLKDQDADYLADILANNDILQELILSRNEFDDTGGDAFGAALVMNDALEVLDLSWNHIRSQGAIAIADGLKQNSSLTHLNVSWNGFGLEGAEAVGIALSKNTCLTHLDLTCNRLNGDAIGALLKGVRLNNSLHTLKLAKNPFPPQVATIILRIITKHSESPLEYLDLSEVVIDDEFQDKLEKLHIIRKITVTHGPLIKKKELRKYEKNAIVDKDPRKVLFDFMAKEGMRVVDLFKRLDTDGSNSLSRAEFKAGLITVDAPLTAAQLDEIVTVFDTDGDGEVDLAELSAGEKIYRRQALAKKLKQQKLKAKQAKEPKDSNTSRFKKKF